MNRDMYSNPLITRYASREMSKIFSDDFKYTTWRKLWIALAEIQKELGVNITEEQLKDLRLNLDKIDYDYVNEVEKQKKHDVMAHIEGYAKYAEEGSAIIHLGATSAFVTDNTDLIQIKEAGRLIFSKLLLVMQYLSKKAYEYRDFPILGFTHFQPAQPTTVGKRFSLWLYDMYEDALEMELFIDNLPFRGTKGTVGSMASYFELFNLDENKCFELDRRISRAFGFKETFPVTGQTYPRKTDYRLSSILSQIAQSFIKMATDIRLLQHRREIMEPFGSSQIGSSAMPYKQNPMKCERITSLARCLISKPVDFANIAANQWLERTLDDSAARRILIPESFMIADAVISLATEIIKGIKINEYNISKNLKTYMPLLISEKLIAEMVRNGIPRQDAHRKIRDISVRLIEQMNLEKIPDEFLKDEVLGKYKDFIAGVLDPEHHTGTCGIQVAKLIGNKIRPFLEKHNALLKEYEYDHSI